VSKNVRVCDRVTGDNDEGTVVLDLTMVDYTMTFYPAVISGRHSGESYKRIEWDIAFLFSTLIS